ncbi:MAG: arsenate reductase (glutaredoxin) [Leptospiraceae bacterium]|nr:arsenate reductase (glutaredoxin) [Leptospiraceae bacterium]
MLKIYHNPRCSKSRETLKLLEAQGVKPEIVEYLKTPPSAEELKTIVRKLGVKPEALIRKKETIFKEKYAGKNMSDDQWIQAIVKDPVLLERPIVVTGKKAAVGRPPENVLKIL